MSEWKNVYLRLEAKRVFNTLKMKVEKVEPIKGYRIYLVGSLARFLLGLRDEFTSLRLSERSRLLVK